MWKSLIKFKNLISESSKPSSAVQTPNFTPRAVQSYVLAHKEAQRLNHLLLGIIRLEQGTAFNVLKTAGLDLEAVQRQVEKLTPSSPHPIRGGKVLVTPRLKKSIAVAQREAKAMDHNDVGTEHMLLALLLEEESGAAGRVLRGFGFNLLLARVLVQEELTVKFEAEDVGF